MVRIKWTDDSFPEVDLSVPRSLGSLILIRTIPMECTIKFLGLPLKESKVLPPERNGRIFSAWDSSSNNACLASLLWKTRWFHHRRYTSWIVLYDKVKTFTIQFDSPYTYQRGLDSRTRTTTSTSFSQYYVAHACEPASFWRENVISAVILPRVLAKMAAKMS